MIDLRCDARSGYGQWGAVPLGRGLWYNRGRRVYHSVASGTLPRPAPGALASGGSRGWGMRADRWARKGRETGQQGSTLEAGPGAAVSGRHPPRSVAGASTLGTHASAVPGRQQQGRLLLVRLTTALWSHLHRPTALVSPSSPVILLARVGTGFAYGRRQTSPQDLRPAIGSVQPRGSPRLQDGSAPW
jgi:hypothetical protein